MKLDKILPWAAGALALLVAGMALRPHGPRDGFDLEAFGRLPVLEGGRVKPVDSVARNALLMLRSKQRFAGEIPAEGGGTVKASFPATQWLLDVVFRPDLANKYPVFVVDDPDVLNILGLDPRGSRTYASYAEIDPHLAELRKQAMIQSSDADQQRVQRAASNLFQRAELHFQLAHTLRVPDATTASLLAAATGSNTQLFLSMNELAQFRPIPPAAGAKPDAWHSIGLGLAELAEGRSADRPFVVGWGELGRAWIAKDAQAFNAAVASLTALVAAAHPAAARQGRAELLFNRVDPFYVGTILYFLALVLLFVSWLWRPEALRRSAFVVLAVGVVIHTAGIVARVVLGGYPPVTNLYSSAVAVGWVAVVVGLLLEARYRRGFGTLVSCAIGAGTLIVAQNLNDKGDTMEMMRAVLDNNFWLATHVITIIIGYGGMYLAGALAIAATLYRHLSPNRDRRDDRLLGSMVYGVTCFALFFSFVGTVLGGIWADQSWGRFWGWDPKENGALLIVLWTAVILHARWGGYVRERGVAAMAIFGNVITSLSWFGVNMLGVGLHSYGFMDKAAVALASFCGSQLLLMGLALAPERFWRAESWRASRASASPEPATPTVHS